PATFLPHSPMVKASRAVAKTFSSWRQSIASFVSFLLFSSLIASIAAANAGSATEPAAASLAFTSKDPMVLQALDLMKSGKFKEAETLLSDRASQDGAEALRVRRETLEVIRRTRLQYSLNADELLAKVRTSVPDATAKEVERWARVSGA